MRNSVRVATALAASGALAFGSALPAAAAPVGTSVGMDVTVGQHLNVIGNATLGDDPSDDVTFNGTVGLFSGNGINLANDISVTNIENGLFRPAPDTVSLATDSQERLRITPTGDVGIGVLTPLERLHVDEMSDCPAI